MPALAPVSWNFTGTVEPILKIDCCTVGLGMLIGWRKFDHPYVTVTVKLPLAVLPWASVAEQLTVVVPTGNVSPELTATGGSPFVQFTLTEPSTRSVALAVKVAVAPLAVVASL